MSDTKAIESVQKVFDALQSFINEKPELDPADYGCHPDQRSYTVGPRWWDNYRSMQSELRAIKNDGTRAREALREAREYPENAAILAEAFDRAFSGRLSWTGTDLEYTAGQYYPTEYRKAACECFGVLLPASKA